jgi:hypothetical protein
MTVTVNHAKTNAISDWTQAQLDEQIALGNFAPGTTLANIVLPSDWNDDHTLTGLGTMAEQNANSVAITGGAIDGTTIGATTASTGKFTSVTTPSVTATVGDLNLTPIGGGNLYLNQSQTGAFGTVIARDVSATTQSSRLFFDSSSGASSIRNSGGNNLSFFTGASIGSSSGVVQQAVSHTASAVNYVQVTGAATTGRPVISVAGSDTNIGVSYTAKGTGIHAFNNGTGTQLVLQTGATSSVNRLEITPTVTGSAPILSAGGSDTNIDLALTPKGTGNVRFGTYTGTILTPTGFITIKDSGGTSRRLLVG